MFLKDSPVHKIVKRKIARRENMEPLYSLIFIMCTAVEYFVSLSKGPYFFWITFIKYGMFLLLIREYSQQQRKRKADTYIGGLFLGIGLIGTRGAILFQQFLQQVVKQGEKLDFYQQLILLVFLPLLLLIILAAVKLKGYKAWFHRYKKRLILLIYLYIWLWFGCLYFYFARQSQGEYYTFTDTGKKEAVIRGKLQEKAYSPQRAFYMQHILKNEEEKMDVLNLVLQGQRVYLTGESVGENWGRFYEQCLVEQGYTHYLTHSVVQEFKLNDEVVSEPISKTYWKQQMGKEYILLKVHLYQLAPFEQERCTYLLDDRRYGTYYRTLKPNGILLLIYTPEEYRRSYRKEKLQPIHYLATVIGDGHTLLDHEAEEISTRLGNEVYYPLEDFLYFSAVIISTLGLGDIIPNNSVVRVFVMIETLVGVVMMGVYLSMIRISEK